MKLGLTMFPTEDSIAPAELARAAEERGFESLWFPEHSHIPAKRESPWPGGPELPKMYYDVMEPFVALAAAAAVTKTLRVATGICLVVQRDPIQTAKHVATLDRVSGGRFLFGIGAGWNAEEMRNHGTDPRTRIALMRERVLAMKEIWTSPKAEFHGKHVDFDPIMAWPKPVQKPHPPIHVGGGFPHGARRAIAYGDGWMPIHGRDEIVARIPEFRRMAAEAGRDPASLEVSVFGARPDRDELAKARDAGVTRAILGLAPEPADKVLPVLDRAVPLVHSLR
ncbi:MAG TPA: LLM class F420-dependent oxidoreductase [Myxococcota bacterium]|nr:LLM class F420-dependent oxidoreductase [Myxococcota bacterium]